METKLNPCPVCGGAAVIEKDDRDLWAGITDKYWVDCYNESCIRTIYGQKSEVVRIWNKVTNPGWQPIETAPEIKGQIVVYDPLFDQGGDSDGIFTVRNFRHNDTHGFTHWRPVYKKKPVVD